MRKIERTRENRLARRLGLFVRDNGVGFDPTDADGISGAFERLSDAAPFEGTGLGLFLVRRGVRRHGHGGQVWAEGRAAASRPAAANPWSAARRPAVEAGNRGSP